MDIEHSEIRSPISGVVLVKASEKRRVITRQITAIRFVAGRCRCSQEIHRHCHLRRRQLEKALHAAGFIVTFHDGYGGMHLPPGARRRRGP